MAIIAGRLGDWLRERIGRPVARHATRVARLAAGGTLLLAAGLVNATNLEVGEKVFVPMFEPNPELDGYAVGFVEELHDDGTVTLRINEVETGKGKTLSGTCHPSGGTPLSGARIVSDDPDALEVEQRLPADQVLTYRRGSQLYLERENLSIAYLKYLGSGMGMTPDRFDVAIRRAENAGLPRMVTAMEIGKMQVESTQGRGFPVPASRALEKAAPMLDAVAAKLESHPEAVETAARMLGGTTPQHRDDPLAAVIVRLHEILDEQLGELEQKSADPREVSGFSVDELLAIYTGWFRVITANDTQPFQNADVAFYRERAAESLQSGEWPSLL
ncbi:hypothetical protein LV475_05740 [Guyparkeria hydrothermalis]|uniref:hypothetical protein n=1 Tax=Guyparkeria TaxID=2035712 RepID=UPI0010ABDFE6|nr:MULTISPECIES: hypothetical protein [Guyparkeria]MCL7751093.1 hypothetical protein [Guyparkeria hydrothermalis]TKA89957.1 hypothetical protein FAZ79_04595 [Guyparkeria sp. SB14A]